MAWQLPHVLAISLLRQDEYAKAGLHVPSMPLGPERTRFWIFITASATVSASLFLGVLGLVGSLYLGFAAAGAGAMMVVALMGLEREVALRWPRWMLRLTVMYLPLLTAGIFLDRWVG
jgi:protoheme IX farnesyltransferase